MLIPPEFKLKVRPSSQCSSPAVAKLLEQQVTVVSNVELPKGVQIHPAQGTVRCGKLDIYSTLPENDVSFFVFCLVRSGNLNLGLFKKVYLIRLGLVRLGMVRWC